jgi:hypothetical protein
MADKKQRLVLLKRGIKDTFTDVRSIASKYEQRPKSGTNHFFRKKNHDLDYMSDKQIRIRGKDARDKDDTQTVISVARSMLSESKVSGGLAN